MVLLVHGGPWARDGYGFDAEHQWLANRGWAVLSVNFRGSTGFGKAFVNAGDLEWGRKMHDDLLDAVDWAVKQGIADRGRIAIMGGSYGGYATLAGLAFTPEVFCCGVDIVGPSNLETLLATIPPYWAAFFENLARRVGDPRTEAGRKLLQERSPLQSRRQHRQAAADRPGRQRPARQAGRIRPDHRRHARQGAARHLRALSRGGARASRCPRTAFPSSPSPRPFWRRTWAAAPSRSGRTSRVPSSRCARAQRTCPVWKRHLRRQAERAPAPRLFRERPAPRCAGTLRMYGRGASFALPPRRHQVVAAGTGILRDCGRGARAGVSG